MATQYKQDRPAIIDVLASKKDVHDIIENTYNTNVILNNDVLKTESVPENAIDLVVTSPPYNVDIPYNSHLDDGDYKSYLKWTEQWLSCCYNWLKSDGRLCLNIPLDKNKGGQQSVGADITSIAKELGYGYHSTVIWNEGNISRRTAWGIVAICVCPICHRSGRVDSDHVQRFLEEKNPWRI